RRSRSAARPREANLSLKRALFLDPRHARHCKCDVCPEYAELTRGDLDRMGETLSNSELNLYLELQKQRLAMQQPSIPQRAMQNLKKLLRTNPNSTIPKSNTCNKWVEKSLRYFSRVDNMETPAENKGVVEKVDPITNENLEEPEEEPLVPLMWDGDIPEEPFVSVVTWPGEEEAEPETAAAAPPHQAPDGS
ncbi:hypothetical protein PTTG_28248, partial [Puccinia triticina 1-1 BBBD Race 1]